jgi:hypothetical protein
MGHGSWLREKVIRDEFIAGRNSTRRVGLLLMNGLDGLRRIPPIRQKEDEWMGHGSWLQEKMIRDGFIAGRIAPGRVKMLRTTAQFPCESCKFHEMP